MSIHEYHTDIWLPKMEEKVRTAEYSQANKDAILEFDGYLFSEGIKSLRVIRYVGVLHKVANISGKDFSSMEKADVRKIVAEIERSKLAPTTKENVK